MFSLEGVLVVNDRFTHYSAGNKCLPLSVFLTGIHNQFQLPEACDYGCNSICIFLGVSPIEHYSTYYYVDTLC